MPPATSKPANGSATFASAIGQNDAAPFARVDRGRLARVGLAEAVYGPGKTSEQCCAIVADLLAHTADPVLLTRADASQIAAVTQSHPGAIVDGSTVTWRTCSLRHGNVVLATAGTADLPVATEAAAVLAAYGVNAEMIVDVGVAGLHRVLAVRDQLVAADVVIVIAGMEGALASVVAGLVAAPVIAVPTSTGYGAGFEGITALLAMLASCAQGLTVVGIDNGFGAACAALRLLNVPAAFRSCHDHRTGPEAGSPRGRPCAARQPWWSPSAAGPTRPSSPSSPPEPSVRTRRLRLPPSPPHWLATKLMTARRWRPSGGFAGYPIETDELADAAYRANDGDRCYYCKTELMRVMAPVVAAEGAVAVLGVNLDDLGDHRPGQRAASEAGARFPLVDAGFTKADVRAASQRLGLRTWDKPAAACLASRVPYGTPVTFRTLTRIDRAEAALRRLGFRQLRVRHYDDLARLEVDLAELNDVLARREAVVVAVKAAGYRYVTLDLEGFRSGNLNLALADTADIGLPLSSTGGISLVIRCPSTRCCSGCVVGVGAMVGVGQLRLGQASWPQPSSPDHVDLRRRQDDQLRAHEQPREQPDHRREAAVGRPSVLHGLLHVDRPEPVEEHPRQCAERRPGNQVPPTDLSVYEHLEQHEEKQEVDREVRSVDGESTDAWQICRRPRRAPPPPSTRTAPHRTGTGSAPAQPATHEAGPRCDGLVPDLVHGVLGGVDHP